MTTGSFRTELPTMGQASSHVMEVNAQVQAQLASLMAKLEPLMGTWQGSAATSFHVLKDRWNADAQKLNLALHGIGEALAANQKNYSTSEETNTSGFSGIASALGG